MEATVAKHERLFYFQHSMQIELHTKYNNVTSLNVYMYIHIFQPATTLSVHDVI